MDAVYLNGVPVYGYLDTDRNPLIRAFVEFRGGANFARMRQASGSFYLIELRAESPLTAPCVC